MERVIIFKNTETGEEIVMPVTPPSYQIEHGRKQNTETLHMVGDVTMPGPAVLLDEEPEFLLPAHDYPFNQPGTILNPFVYLEKLEKWSDAGTVLRYVVANTPVNAAVRLGPIRFREEDGTNDVKCIVPIRGVRQLEAEEVEIPDSAAPLADRAVEGTGVKAGTYTVAKGDTLSGICKKFYGDPSLAAALGSYNGVKNISLIYVGQVLNMPDKSALPATVALQNGKVTPKKEASSAVSVTVAFDGPSTYYGRVKIYYTPEGGAATETSLGPVPSSVTLKVKRGSSVTILRQESSYKISYYSIDGKTRTGFSKLPITADKDRMIRVGWGV